MSTMSLDIYNVPELTVRGSQDADVVRLSPAFREQDSIVKYDFYERVFRLRVLVFLRPLFCG